MYTEQIFYKHDQKKRVITQVENVHEQFKSHEKSVYEYSTSFVILLHACHQTFIFKHR